MIAVQVLSTLTAGCVLVMCAVCARIMIASGDWPFALVYAPLGLLSLALALLPWVSQ